MSVNLLMTPIPAALITGSIAATSAYIAFRNRQSERVKLARDLYNQFFTMTDSRSAAWFWLEDLESEQVRRSFEQTWRVVDQRAFMNLYKVVAFWFLLYTLYKAHQLDKKLARSLFRYEFCYWQKQLDPLTKRTRLMDKDFPEVLIPFESIDWLLKP
jgi:hypothetical protein